MNKQTGLMKKGGTENVDIVKKFSMEKPKPAEEIVCKAQCVSLAFAGRGNEASKEMSSRAD